MAESANTRAKTNMDGTKRIIEMEQGEEETKKRRYVKCQTCKVKETWERYTIFMGSVPKFCKCKVGEEVIVTIWE